MSCPSCKIPWAEFPAHTLVSRSGEHGQVNNFTRRNLEKSAAWISRPIQRKDSSSSSKAIANSINIDYSRSPEHERRASSIITDESSLTHVERAPTFRSILSGASSVNSSKISTLGGKRSVKFSEEPNVYYDDNTYRYSHPCGHDHDHVDHCKLGFDCDGSCTCDTNFRYVDYDMFSFELPDEIPSEKKWGILSRLIAWLRKLRGSRIHSGISSRSAGCRRPAISRPYRLGAPEVALALRDKNRRLRSSESRSTLRKAHWDTLSCG